MNIRKPNLERPKRPVSSYFKFRFERLALYKDKTYREQKQLIKREWNDMDPKIKEKLGKECQAEMEDWKVKINAWVERNDKDERQKDKKSA
jgi:hypothetical protein